MAAIVQTAPPASAHGSAGQAATNWRSAVTGFEGPNPGGFATTTDLGDHIQLTTDGTRTVIVFGYNNEPYVRLNAQGVSINTRSPAGFLNRSTNAPSKVPERFDPDAPAEWRKISSDRTFRWHDHRTHRAPGSAPRNWTIPISVDGQTGQILGALTYVSAETPNAALFVGVFALGVFAAFAMLRPRIMAMAAATIAAICGTAMLIGQHQASTEPWQKQLGATLYSVGTIVSAIVVFVAAMRRSPATAAPAVLLASVALLVCGGFARFDWLTHSQLPTQLNYSAATICVILPMVIAVVLSAGAIIELLRPPMTEDAALAP